MPKTLPFHMMLAATALVVFGPLLMSYLNGLTLEAANETAAAIAAQMGN